MEKSSTLSILLDVWGVGTPDPRGVVEMKRLFARGCGMNVLCREIVLSYHGVSSDRDWLSAEKLLTLGKFFRFRIPGRFQSFFAGADWLPRIWVLPKADLYHSCTPYPITMGPMRGVGTLVDFVPLRVPEFASPRLSKDQADWCDWVRIHPERQWVAISERTRQDAITFGNVRESQVHVVNLAVDEDIYVTPERESIQNALDGFGLRSPYLLYVSTLNPRKNHERLLDAWRMGNFAREGWSLVLVGTSAGRKDMFIRELRERCGKDRIVWLEYVKRADLKNLYYGCDVFIYPSLYEGYGIPVAEAIVAGKPVITSKDSPMADIAGFGAIHVDPGSIEDIAGAMYELISSSKRRQELSETNMRNRGYFHGKRMAKDLLQAYQAILEN